MLKCSSFPCSFVVFSIENSLISVSRSANRLNCESFRFFSPFWFWLSILNQAKGWGFLFSSFSSKL